MTKDKALETALAGYNQETNPWLWSSDYWLIHEAGLALWKGGYTKPISAKKSRGFSVKLQTACNDFIVKFNGDLKQSAIKRL